MRRLPFRSTGAAICLVAAVLVPACDVEDPPADLELPPPPPPPVSAYAIVFANRPPLPSPEIDYEIWSLDDGTAKQLTQNTVQDTDPSWSPDRSEIAFLRLVSDRWVVMVMDADGGNQRVEADFVSKSALRPAWAPAGNKIAVSVSTPGDADGEIWVVDLDEDPSSPDRRKQLTSGADDLSPTWSWGGAEIAFTRNGEGIYMVATDGQSGTSPVFADATKAPAAPDWGEDGFVFQSYVGEVFGYRIARIDAVGGDFRSVTSGGTHIGDATPKWRADGYEVLFVRESLGGGSRLRISDVAPANSDREVPGQPAGDNSTPDW